MMKKQVAEHMQEYPLRNGPSAGLQPRRKDEYLWEWYKLYYPSTQL